MSASSHNLLVQNSYLAIHLKVTIAALGINQADAVICAYHGESALPRINLKATAKSADWEAWQAILECERNVSEVMVANLPSFWRIGKAYMDGKFKVTKSRILAVFLLLITILVHKCQRLPTPQPFTSPHLCHGDCQAV